MLLKKFSPFTWLFLAAVFLQNGFGQEIDPSALSLKSTISVEAGRVEDGFYKNASRGGPIQRQWLSTTKVNLQIERALSLHLKVQAGLEGKMWFSAYPSEFQISPKQYNMPTSFFDFYLDKAQLLYEYGTADRFFLDASIGYFPFKYNPDIRNLGEYLFRSGTYPAFLVNEFDYARARLLGFRLGNRLYNIIKQDLLVSFETSMQPFFDGSISYIASADFANALEIGGGVSWSRLIQADKKLTATKNGQTLYFAAPDSTDTSYYTLSGTKLMGRASFDPKRLFGWTEGKGILKEDDGRIYAEAAILGLENYPANPFNPSGYDALAYKMPMMIGMNIPAYPLISYGSLALIEGLALMPGFTKDKLGIPSHPVLAMGVFPAMALGSWAMQRFLNIDASSDLFSAEVEWYGCRYPNSYYNVAAYHLAIPATLRQGMVPPNTYTDYDNWKWSLYLKKNITPQVCLYGQASRDHMRLPVKFSEDMDREEAMSSVDSWSWMLKMSVSF